MRLSSVNAPTTSASSTAVRPSDGEIDMFGLTHQGHRRSNNQDHFLIATIHAEIRVHGTSLADTAALAFPGSRLATVLVVADGVGGTSDGAAAAKLATESVMQYLASSLRCYHEMVQGVTRSFSPDCARPRCAHRRSMSVAFVY
ncbi:MAG: hypothetical protein ABIW79_06595 [Gemmatimonas sp.]